jgi:hypothetical protein
MDHSTTRGTARKYFRQPWNVPVRGSGKSNSAEPAQGVTCRDGCGGWAGQVELLTGIEGASSRPVRKIVLLG